ncbi:hypothetical protein HaLaN_24016, partial [Haematococcus lacustris]
DVQSVAVGVLGVAVGVQGVAVGVQGVAVGVQSVAVGVPGPVHLVQFLELGNWPGTAGLLKHGHLTGQQPDAAVVWATHHVFLHTCVGE